jgi:hypothetical protein
MLRRFVRRTRGRRCAQRVELLVRKMTYNNLSPCVPFRDLDVSQFEFGHFGRRSIQPLEP